MFFPTKTERGDACGLWSALTKRKIRKRETNKEVLAEHD